VQMHQSRPIVGRVRGALSPPPKRAQFLRRGKRKFWTRSTSPLRRPYFRACVRACGQAGGRCDAYAAGEQDLPKDDPFKPGSTRPQIDPIRKAGTKPKPYQEVIIGKRGIGQKHVACHKTLCPQCRVPAQRELSCSLCVKHHVARHESLKTCPFSKSCSPLRARSRSVCAALGVRLPDRGHLLRERRRARGGSAGMAGTGSSWHGRSRRGGDTLFMAFPALRVGKPASEW
jgi:hypothetical protein